MLLVALHFMFRALEFRDDMLNDSVHACKKLDCRCVLPVWRPREAVRRAVEILQLEFELRCLDAM